CLVTTRRSARNAATASRMTVRLTPVAAIISCSVGKRAPGESFPLVMSAVSLATNSAVSRRGASTGCIRLRFFGLRLAHGFTSRLHLRASYDLINNIHGRLDQMRRYNNHNKTHEP